MRSKEDFRQLVALQEELVLDQVEEFYLRGKLMREHYRCFIFD